MATVKRVGLVYGEEDRHIRALAAELERQGHEAVDIDASELSAASLFSLRQDAAFLGNRPMAELSAVFLRSILSALPGVYLAEGEYRVYSDWYESYTLAAERQALVMGWLMNLQEYVPFVNPLRLATMSPLKPVQMGQLTRAGIRVPRTLVSNDRQEIEAFRRSVGDTIFKPLMGGRYCDRLTDEVLREVDWGTFPAVFQEYVPGENVRISALPGEILSACAVSGDEIDFRAAEEFIAGREPMREIDLPDDARRMCWKALEACGFLFSGIDLKGTVEDGFVLLECNQRPAWLHIEDATGAPITRGLAAFLARL